jgi:hypothetical protein
MTKQEWELKHKYRKSEHTCPYCKHCVAEEIDPWTYKYSCGQMEQAGAGKTVKPSYDCDLWERL